MMSLIRTMRPLTLVLSLTIGAIVAAIAQLVVRGTQAEQLLATPPRQFTATSVNLDVQRPAVDLEPIRDHTLFYASRAFYVPPPPSPEPATPPRPNYQLAGTFIIPSKPTVALLKSSGGIPRKVIPGDDLDGWHVQAVESQRVVLDYKGEQIEIVRDAKTKSSGLTIAPIVRASAATPAAPPASTPDASLQSSADANPQPARAVKVLGNGGDSQSALRAVSATTSPTRIEARLYRPAPQ